MNKIHTLSTEIINQIAAGQVIERPSSVVKELVENSIDAGATRIEIEIEQSGMQLIRIVDNGEGMSKNDIELAPLPHTTSKINSLKDLYNINSLGFRGEALASIAAVAEVTIKSRKDKYGYQVKIINGEIGSPEPVGIQKGTIVEVRNLFSNIPARKKDIKSIKKESNDITRTVSEIALAYPEISFSLSNDSSNIFQAIAHTPRERLQTVLGEFVTDGSIPINIKESGVQVSGYIGSPQLAIKQKTRQYLYVNRRIVRNSEISSQIKNLYGTLIDPRLNPAFVIYLELPADYIDVNIHPRKEDIKFYTPDVVTKLIEKAIKQQLNASNHTYQFSLQQSMSKKTAFVIKDAVSKWSVKSEESITNEVIQVDKTFLVTQTASNLLIIDQHAAHERILYEQFIKTFDNLAVKKHTFRPAQPIKISLPVHEKKFLDENINVFNKLGFNFFIQEDDYLLTQAPVIFQDRNLNQLISEVLGDLSDDSFEIDTLTHRTLSFLACRSAIKAGDELTAEEAKRLLDKLYKTKTNYTCPHGRPVLIEIPMSQLHIAFRRK